MHIQTRHKPTYPGGRGSVPALPGCCLTGSADALEVKEDSLGFAASAALLFLAVGWAQSVVAVGSSSGDTTGNAEVWLSEQLVASLVDWGSAVVLLQSEDTTASTEPTGASETEELPASGAEADDSPLTEKWEIKTFVHQNLMKFIFQMANFWGKHVEGTYLSHAYMP